MPDKHEQILLILAIIKAVCDYGPNAVVTISNAMKVGNVTAEAIEALFITKNAEDYF